MKSSKRKGRIQSNLPEVLRQKARWGREEMSIKDTEDGPQKRSSVERADKMFSF